MSRPSARLKGAQKLRSCDRADVETTRQPHDDTEEQIYELEDYECPGTLFGMVEDTVYSEWETLVHMNRARPLWLVS